MEQSVALEERGYDSFNLWESKHLDLRDDCNPDGFSWLRGNDKVRTEAANLLCEATVLVARTAIHHNIAVTIENRANSLMWKTSPFVHLFSDFPELKFVTLQLCLMEEHETNSHVLPPMSTGLIHFHFGATGNIFTPHGRQL